MKSAVRVVAGAVVTIVLAGAGWAEPTDEPLFVRVDPRAPRRVIRWDSTVAESRAFYEAAGPVGNLEVAPDGRRAALLELVSGVVEGEGYGRAPRSTLAVLDARGRLLRSVDDVWHFTWSPDGTEIAYVTGIYYEGAVGFAPATCHLMRIADGNSRRLAGLDHSYELHWLRAASEDALYAKVLPEGEARQLVRLDLESQKVSRPAARAFHFSPDGEFYYFEPSEAIEHGLCSPGRGDDTCLRVFERRNDRAVAGLAARSRGAALGWVGGEGHRLLFATAGASGTDSQAVQTIVVDVATGQEVDLRVGETLGGAAIHLWKGARRELP